MKRPLIVLFTQACLVLMLLTLPLVSRAQLPDEPDATPPPIAQNLVREGELAVKLVFALGVGVTQDEAEAETRLGELGIVPRNGWIADYPVTPDIIGELQQAVGAAAEAKKLQMSRDEALSRLNKVMKEFDLAVRPHAKGVPDAAASGETAQPVTEINTYYSTEGPPVVTYYAPPPEWYYLYGWVPSPFWYGSFWFPGFYVLYDFHRPLYLHNRPVFISNHFNDVRRHRVYRVDPVNRYNGRTFSGIGAPHRRDFIGTGVERSDRRIFNAPRAVTSPGMRPTPGMRTYAVPSRESERTYVPTQRSMGRSIDRGSERSAPTFGGGERRGGAGRGDSSERGQRR